EDGAVPEEAFIEAQPPDVRLIHRVRDLIGICFSRVPQAETPQVIEYLLQPITQAEVRNGMSPLGALEGVQHDEGVQQDDELQGTTTIASSEAEGQEGAQAQTELSTTAEQTDSASSTTYAQAPLRTHPACLETPSDSHKSADYLPT
ncbi:unnamed protein product, partial [Amoebophrya sp. A25]